MKSEACDLLVIGAGGHALSITGLLRALGSTVRYYVDPNRNEAIVNSIPVIEDITHIQDFWKYSVVIAIADNFRRRIVYEQLIGLCPSLNFPAVVHPTAFVDSSADIGPGSVIFAMAHVGPMAKLEPFTVVNTHSDVEHGGRLAAFSGLAPGVLLSGDVCVGEMSYIGIGSVVKQKVKIGRNVVIGAGSFVSQNIPDDSVAFGTPARLVRSRVLGESYL